MPICRECNKKFPNKVFYKDKELNTSKRKYCIECSPPFERKYQRKLAGAKNRVGPSCITCGNLRDTKKNAECSTCRSRGKREKHRRLALDLLGNKCSACNYSRCDKVLDFHHIDEKQKLFTLSTCWHLSWKKLQEEIKKCILLCANCHREFHAGFLELDKPL